MNKMKIYDVFFKSTMGNNFIQGHEKVLAPTAKAAKKLLINHRASYKGAGKNGTIITKCALAKKVRAQVIN